MPATIPITVEFNGGLEMLFSDQKLHKVSVPAHDAFGDPANVTFLTQWLCDKVMRDSRKEMFVLDGTVRPGVLVLINDADWELEGEGKYEIQAEDNFVFVSTLHGG